MQHATLKFSWEANRFAKMEDFLKQQALLLDLECETVVRKGWIMEDGAVKVSGPADKVMRFKYRFEQAVKYYNKD